MNVFADVCVCISTNKSNTHIVVHIKLIFLYMQEYEY